jgi:TorA maturation chaperone TorD
MTAVGADRRRTYELLAAILRRSPDARVLEELGLAPEPAKGTALPDPDVLAADHESLFGFNVPPYASVFLEPDGILGGAATTAAGSYRGRAGLLLVLDEPADHLANELEMLSQLVDPASGPLAGIEIRDALAAEFIDDHVFSWLPSFVRAVCAEGHPMYVHVAGVMLETVVGHRRDLKRQANSPARTLPPLTPLLEDPKTSLSDIAAFLTAPAWCGFYLSRSSIGRLSGRGRAPHGFGRRRSMLETLVRSAAVYGELPLVERGLREECAAARGVWEDFGRTGTGSAPEWAGAWLERLRGSERLVEAFMTAAQDGRASE